MTNILLSKLHTYYTHIHYDNTFRLFSHSNDKESSTQLLALLWSTQHCSCKNLWWWWQVIKVSGWLNIYIYFPTSFSILCMVWLVLSSVRVACLHAYCSTSWIRSWRVSHKSWTDSIKVSENLIKVAHPLCQILFPNYSVDVCSIGVIRVLCARNRFLGIFLLLLYMYLYSSTK